MIEMVLVNRLCKASVKKLESTKLFFALNIYGRVLIIHHIDKNQLMRCFFKGNGGIRRAETPQKE